MRWDKLRRNISWRNKKARVFAGFFGASPKKGDMTGFTL